MECSIDSTKVVPFAKAIQCLAKIGDSLSFEITPTRFILRTLGEGEAAYFQINLSPISYFTEYKFNYINNELRDRHNNDDNYSNASTSEIYQTIKMKIKSKIFLSTLRLHDGIVSLSLIFSPLLHKLDVILSLAYSIQRKYQISFEEQDTILQADFNISDNNISSLTCHPLILKRALNNFSNSLSEITLILNADILSIKSFTDINILNENDILNNNGIHTECQIMRQQLIGYNITQSSINLSIVQKEFKAYLDLCHSLGQTINMYMTSGGSPIMLINVKDVSNNNDIVHVIDYNAPIVIKLIMATISDDFQQIEQPKPPKQAQVGVIPSSVGSVSGKHKKQKRNVNMSEHNAVNARRIRKQQQQQQDDDNATLLAQRMMSSHVPETPNLSKRISNYNNNNNNNSIDDVDFDDSDVLDGMPTHDGIPQQQCNTTINITVRDNDNDNGIVIENENVLNKNKMDLLQPHPHSSQAKRMNNNNNNNNACNGANFDVNPPKNDNNKRRDHLKKILPSNSSQRSLNVQNRRDIVNLIDDDDDDGNGSSLDTQNAISSGRVNTLNNNNNINYISSIMGSFDDNNNNRNTNANYIPATQKIDQIADRLERERLTKINQNNKYYYHNKNRKRRVDDDVDNKRPNKRQRYNNYNNNNNFSMLTNSLRKKPKRPYNQIQSPDN